MTGISERVRIQEHLLVTDWDTEGVEAEFKREGVGNWDRFVDIEKLLRKDPGGFGLWWAEMGVRHNEKISSGCIGGLGGAVPCSSSNASIFSQGQRRGGIRTIGVMSPLDWEAGAFLL